MIDSDEKPLPAVGAYWLEEADYPAAKQLFDDRDTLPSTWKEWLKMAEEMEKGLKAYGHPVMRVRIDPATFAQWCAAHGTHAGPAGAQGVRRRRRPRALRRPELSALPHRHRRVSS